MSLMNSVILNLTPTGMVPTKEMTPHVPTGIGEIVDDVAHCAAIGITSVHLHARDEQGRPTHRGDVYERLVGGIRRAVPGLVTCVSLSGRTVRDPKARAEPLYLTGDAKPDMGSLTLSSLNFTKEASVNDPDTIAFLAEQMMSLGIVPELEIFDLGMVNYAKYLIRKGLIRAPFYANIFLGNVAGAQLDLAHAALLVRDLPDNTYWSFGGIGGAQLYANTLALATGGGVRVGLEDSIHMDLDRRLLATNHELVVRIHTLAALLDRQIMRPSTFRACMNLRGGK